MLYVGLDVHQKRSSICILDDNGKTVKEELINGPFSALIDRLRRIDQPMSVCYEASCGYGHLHDRIAPLASRVTVAHPGQLRLIFKSKKKHDRVDAAKIAKLLYLDEVPAVYVPGIDVRSWRKLIEYRQTLLAQRVAVKNQIRAILRGNGIAAPKGLAKSRRHGLSRWSCPPVRSWRWRLPWMSWHGSVNRSNASSVSWRRGRRSIQA
jgi:transposase